MAATMMLHADAIATIARIARAMDLHAMAMLTMLRAATTVPHSGSLGTTAGLIFHGPAETPIIPITTLAITMFVGMGGMKRLAATATTMLAMLETTTHAMAGLATAVAAI
jgi:hypothetical protein